ncbi:MAG TPA: hypothetical protein VLA76_08105 [Candidatus Angelobacter sp.]|nr:hypothetical protein [Candidatus Angelobacter sp.]
MQRLRSTWMALMGGALLVTLSISSAFGAPPSATDDGPRGQSVAAYVHSLIFGEQPADDVDESEEEQEETEEGSEEEELEENLEEEEEADEELDEQLDEEVEQDEDEASDSHGACVSAVAQDKEGDNDPEGAEYRNHGERVSEAARFLCWPTDEEDEESNDEVAEEEQEEQVTEEEDEESDSHGACVSAVAQDKEGDNDPVGAEYRNHGERVSHASRVLCRENGDDEEAEEDAADEEADAEGDESETEGAAAAAKGNGGPAKANGKANAPGQQKASQAGGQGNGKGGGKGGGGNGRGGR